MPSASRRSDKRDRITEAAIEVFAEKGFSQARVSDVAKRAGVADGTIYLYFKSKDDLLLSVFEEKMDELLTGLRAALAGCEDPEEAIRRFTRYHFEQIQLHRSTAEVLQLELRMSRKFLKEYRPEKLWAYLAVFRDLLADGQRRGVFRADVDPFIAMWSFFGAMDELGVQWVLARNNSRFALDDAARQVAEIFLRGVKVSPPGHPPQGPPPTRTTEVP